MYTFPGGRIEDSDRELAEIHLSEINAFHKSYYSNKWYPAAIIAALRETKEETGLVFSAVGQPEDGGGYL